MNESLVEQVNVEYDWVRLVPSNYSSKNKNE